MHEIKTRTHRGIFNRVLKLFKKPWYRIRNTDSVAACSNVAMFRFHSRSSTCSAYNRETFEKFVARFPVAVFFLVRAANRIRLGPQKANALYSILQSVTVSVDQNFLEPFVKSVECFVHDTSRNFTEIIVYTCQIAIEIAIFCIQVCDDANLNIKNMLFRLVEFPFIASRATCKLWGLF